MVGESGSGEPPSVGFQGAVPARLDDKGRVPIPVQFRNALKREDGTEEPLMITIFGVAGVRCLEAHPLSAWQRFLAEFEAGKDQFSGRRAHFRSVSIGSASPCQLDRQGRALIPQTLRAMAKLDHELQIVGVGSKLQIFSKDGYAQVVERFLEKFADPDGDGFGGMQ